MTTQKDLEKACIEFLTCNCEWCFNSLKKVVNNYKPKKEEPRFWKVQFKKIPDWFGKKEQEVLGDAIAKCLDLDIEIKDEYDNPTQMMGELVGKLMSHPSAIKETFTFEDFMKHVQ